MVAISPLRKAWTDERDHWERETGTSVDRSNFLEVYRRVYLRALSNVVVRSAFRKTGIWPFNPAVVPLNGYLYRFHLWEDDSCPHCPGETETVEHYLFECPEYRWERHQLRRRLGRGANSMACLTGTKTGTRQLLRFVEATGRFPNFRKLATNDDAPQREPG